MGTSGLDVEKAVLYLQRTTGPVSLHSCAKAIRLALEAGGLTLTGHPVDAKDYGPFLLRKGFTPIPQTAYRPVTGDIVVIQAYATGNPSGHIEMYDGTRWLSDFRQMAHDQWPGGGYRAAKPPYAIYRP